MKILVVVDMQNDFIDGALGTRKRSGSLTEGFFIPEIPTKKITWRLRREEICRFHTASGERKAGNWPRRSKRSGWKKPGKRLLISRPLEAVSLDSY